MTTTHKLWLGLFTYVQGQLVELNQAQTNYSRQVIDLVDGVHEVLWPAATSNWGRIDAVGVFFGPSPRLAPLWTGNLVMAKTLNIGDAMSFTGVAVRPEVIELVELLKGNRNMADLKAWIGLLDVNYDELKGTGYDRIQIELKDGVCRHPAVVWPPALDNWGIATYVAFYHEKTSPRPVAVTLFNSGNPMEVTSQTVIQLDNFQCDASQLQIFEREMMGEPPEPLKPIEVTGEMSAKFSKMDELLRKGGAA
jgi:hypothetical protein